MIKIFFIKGVLRKLFCPFSTLPFLLLLLQLKPALFKDVQVSSKSWSPQKSPKFDNCAFYGCYSLTQIDILNSVASIGQSAFQGCSKIQQINSPNSITEIATNVFCNFQALQQIKIPEKVTSIGNNAFYQCSSLK